jgi:hypothetical protein
MSEKKQEQQSKKDEQKTRDRQQEQGEAEWAPQVDTELSADLPGDLPSHPSTLRLRQAAVLQMQRKYGNQDVLRYLARKSDAQTESQPRAISSEVDDDRPIKVDDGSIRPGDSQVGSQADQLTPAVSPPSSPTPAADDIATLSTEPESQNRLRPIQTVDVSQGATPTIQRQLGGEAGTGGGKVALSTPAWKKEFKLKYAEATLSPTAEIYAELKPKAEAKAGVSAGSGGAKISANVYKKAKEVGGSKFAQMAREKLLADKWSVKKVDWDMGKVNVGESKTGGGEASFATGVKVIFDNDHEVNVDATVFGRSAEAGLEGPGVSVEPVLKFPSVTVWENKDAILTFSGEVKVKLSLKPSWLEIWKDLSKRGGRYVARQITRAALRGMVNFFLGAGGFILGGVITLAATAAALIEAKEIKSCISTAVKAAESYVRGYCVSWGITKYGMGGIESFFNEGKSAGSAKLNEMINKIKEHPLFKSFEFTAAEVREAIQKRFSTAGEQIDRQVWDQVKGESQSKIYTEFVIEFYKTQLAWYRPEYISYKNAKTVAMNLGVDEEVIPRPAG